MQDRIFVIDFAGTLIKAEIIEEANKLRADILNKALPIKAQHADPEHFYKINREFVKKLTDIKDSDIIRYRKNDHDFMDLSGLEIKNQISTNLFQIGMFMAAKKYKENIIPDGLIEQLIRIKTLGYKLAIISGVRTDIISGMLKIANIQLEFDYIYGQPPILGIENQQQDIEEIQKQGTIEFNMGDKLSDLQRTGEGTKLIFAKWGHPSGGEEDMADYTIENPKELEKIIR